MYRDIRETYRGFASAGDVKQFNTLTFSAVFHKRLTAVIPLFLCARCLRLAPLLSHSKMTHWF